MPGISVGRDKGYPTTKINAKARPARSMGRLSKRTGMVRELVGEVVGMSPYERKMLDMLKTGGASAEKRMYKYAKRKLGTHKRAQKKRELIKDTYGKLRAKAAMA